MTEAKFIDRGNDEEIIDIMNSIFSNADFTVETINESILVKLMELRGTPIKYNKTLRDIDKDFKRWMEDGIQKQSMVKITARSKAPEGKFRVICVDTINGHSWIYGNFDTKDIAIEKARKRGDIIFRTYVYDDNGDNFYIHKERFF